MPDFEVTGPDGKTYDVSAPEGATQDQAFEFFKQNFKPGAAAQTPAAPLGFHTNRSGLRVENAPPDTTPDAPRWDIVGDIKRDFLGSMDALRGDLKAGFRSEHDIQKSEAENREQLGAVGGYLKDQLIDTPVQGAHVLKAPLDVLGAAMSPFSGLVHGTAGSLLSYAPGSSKKQADAALDLFGVLGGGEGGAGALGKLGKVARGPTPAERMEKAYKIVNRRADQDALTGATAAQQQEAAAKTGDKLAPLDMGKNLRGEAGKVYRMPGRGGKIIDDFLRTRDKEVGPQLDKEISEIAEGSTFDALQDLYKKRTEGSHGFWEKAFDHGSTAPFEKHFESAFGAADKAEHEAQASLAAARNEQMMLERKAATNSNIYSTPTPAEKAAARTKVNDLEFRVEAIRAQKERTRELLRKAQEDGTANAPGATWSPRLEEFRQDPDVQRGLVRGLKIEKKNALAEGRPFHDRDYSIVGYDEKGDPIVGAVPTMRAWAAAKEGMDAIAMEQVHPVGHASAGRPTKEGLANRKLRDALRGELVTLNPNYGKALEAWSGPSASIDAMNQGKAHFSSRDSFEEKQANYSKLSASDKEFYKLGAAEDMIVSEKRTALGGDETKAIHNSRSDEELVRMLFDDPKEADQFVDSVMRKRQMFESKQAVMGGSQTAERVAEDKSRVRAAGENLASSVDRFLHGHPIVAARDLFRAGQAMTSDQKLNEDMARILTNPDFGTAEGKAGTFAQKPSPQESVLQQMGLDTQ